MLFSRTTPPVKGLTGLTCPLLMTHVSSNTDTHPQQLDRYSVRHQNPEFPPTPYCRTTVKKSGGSETKRGLRRISGVCGHGVSQEPKAKSPAWCGALSALQPD